MTAYVHVGTPKTATTTIQKFLNHNYKILLNKGFLYPQSIVNSNCNHQYLVNLCRKYCGVDEFKFIKDIPYLKLIRELNNHNKGKVIFSSEGFSFATSSQEKRQIKDILYSLGLNKVYIIIYVRETCDFLKSFISQAVKGGDVPNYFLEIATKNHHNIDLLDIRKYLHDLTNVFGKDNLIVRLFDKNEFKDGDLLKDFVDAIGLGWDENFIIPENQNEALDLLGMKLQHSLNKIFRGWMEPNRVLMRGLSQKHFSSNDKELKFSPPKEILQSYIDYFEESNEWVRKEFFPHKERLFTKKDLTNYKENYELKEMKPEYWDRIAAFIADIVKTKNQAITNKDNLIKQKDTQLQTLQSKINTLTHQNTQLNNTINSIPHKKANLELESLQLDIANKKLNLKKQEKELGIKLSKLEPKIILNLINPNSATQRIKNQLSYKLGVALINNSKSLLGYIRMPYVLSYIKETHQKEQELYKQSITQNPNLKLPPLESYPDYEEAIKIKNHLTYKLGEALIKANNVREGGKNTLLYPLLKRSA